MILTAPAAAASGAIFLIRGEEPLLKSSLFVKTFFSTVCVILISFSTLTLAFVYQANSYALEEKQRNLKNAASRTLDNTAFLLSNFSTTVENIYALNLTLMARDLNSTIIVCDTSGQIAYYADENGCFTPTNSRISASYLQGLSAAGGYNELGTLGGMLSTANYIHGETLTVNGSVAGAVFVATPAGSTINLIRSIIQYFFFITLIILMITLMFTYYITARMTRPLKRMATAAKSFAHGDFSTRVEVEDRCDEIGELALSFNNMASSLETTERNRHEFVANVSHDLKTPMTTIGGFVDGILDGTIPPEREREYLSIISDEVKRLSRLASKMLQAEKVYAGKLTLNKTQFDLCDMVSRILLSFEQVIGQKQIDVDADFPVTLGITADRDNIFQVMYNLVDNAVKFTEDGGRLRLSLASSGGNLVFKVMNTGSTIPPEDLRCIFDRFYKVDRSRGLNDKGSGLGLYIVKTIVNAHGGNISVTSENGETEFTVSLPAE